MSEPRRYVRISNNHEGKQNFMAKRFAAWAVLCALVSLGCLLMIPTMAFLSWLFGQR